MLTFAVFSFLGGMPADGSRIKENLRASERRQARSFGIPLIPTNLRAHISIARLEGLEAEITRREIEFFVIERVIGNMHFAIAAREFAVRIDDHCGVVIEAGCSAFEERADDHYSTGGRQFRQSLGARAGD